MTGYLLSISLQQFYLFKLFAYDLQWKGRDDLQRLKWGVLTARNGHTLLRSGKLVWNMSLLRNCTVLVGFCALIISASESPVPPVVGCSFLVFPMEPVQQLSQCSSFSLRFQHFPHTCVKDRMHCSLSHWSFISSRFLFCFFFIYPSLLMEIVGKDGGGQGYNKESWSSWTSLSLGLSLKGEPFSALSPLHSMDTKLYLQPSGGHQQKSLLPALCPIRPSLCINAGSPVFPGLLLESSWFCLFLSISIGLTQSSLSTLFHA